MFSDWRWAKQRISPWFRSVLAGMQYRKKLSFTMTNAVLVNHHVPCLLVQVLGSQRAFWVFVESISKALLPSSVSDWQFLPFFLSILNPDKPFLTSSGLFLCCYSKTLHWPTCIVLFLILPLLFPAWALISSAEMHAMSIILGKGKGLQALSDWHRNKTMGSEGLLGGNTAYELR